MSMTKKDYELIAEAINKSEKRNYGSHIITGDLVHNLMIALKQDNPRFNSDKFIIACGI